MSSQLNAQNATLFLILRAIERTHATLKATTNAVFVKNIVYGTCISPQLIFGLNDKRFLLERALFGTIIMSCRVSSRER